MFLQTKEAVAGRTVSLYNDHIVGNVFTRRSGSRKIKEKSEEMERGKDI